MGLQNLYQVAVMTSLSFYAISAAVLIAGIRRKLRARLQGRVGPPIWQPLLDFAKLLYKRPTIPSSASLTFIGAPCISFLASLAAAVLVPVALNATLGFEGDLIVLFLLFFAGEAAIVLGGLASGNPYSWLSSSRSLIIMLTREVMLGAALLLLYAAAAPQLSLRSVLLAVPLPVAAPLALFFIAFALASSLTTLLSAPLAETELLEGYLIEYSGPFLAVAELAHWLLAYTPLALAASLLLAAGSLLELGWLTVVAHFLLLVVFSAALALLDVAFARLRIWEAVKLVVVMLGALIAVGVIALVVWVGA